MLLGTACAPLARGVGSQPPTLVLTFANPLDDHRHLQPIADTVERLSAGSMQIEFDDRTHRDRPDTEPAIIDEVVTGRFDMGWVAQRPWPERGIKAFDALVAPLLIDSYPLEGAVLGDPIADEMLAALEGTGVVGLGIVPGPIRYVATRDEPVLDLGSLQGMTVATDDTSIAKDALETLGAKTTKEMPLGGADLTGAGAVIQQLPSIEGNRYDLEMPHVTGLALWPRPVIVIMNKPRFDSLSNDQRAWLVEGIDAAVADQLAALPTADAQAIEHMCENGTTIASPTEEQRDAFTAAIQPAYERLSADPLTGRAIDRILELKAGLAPAQPLPACDSGTTPVASSVDGVGFPEGRYVADVSPEEQQAAWERFDVPLDQREICPCKYEGTFADGKWTTTDGTLEFSFAGDHVTIRDGLWSLTVRWAYDPQTRELTFSEPRGGVGPGDYTVCCAVPWVKVE
jgi:TRAP-type C4-dicarboxylate transport system substrate-binding protein